MVPVDFFHILKNLWNGFKHGKMSSTLLKILLCISEKKKRFKYLNLNTNLIVKKIQTLGMRRLWLGNWYSFPVEKYKLQVKISEKAFYKFKICYFFFFFKG